jgi:hypothetical protein
MKTYTATLHHLNTVKIFWSFVFVIIGQVALYLTFVNLAIFNTAARESALDKARTLVSETAEYEYRYLGLEEAVTPEKATALGFENGELRTVFVFADTAKTAGVLAQNDR